MPQSGNNIVAMKKIIILFLIFGGLFLESEVALALSAPKLIAPDDGIILKRLFASVIPSVTLKWEAVLGADRGYHYLVSDKDGKTFKAESNYEKTEVIVKI